MNINKDTVLYGSFSSNPGNQGCKRFNNAFQKNGINAIYQSHKFGFNDNLDSLFEAVRFLKFAGFAVSMPIKQEIVKYISNSFDPLVVDTGNVNTLVKNEFDGYNGYNTDIIGIEKYYLSTGNQIHQKIYIIGMGAFAKSAQYVFNKLGKDVYFINSRSGNIQEKIERASPALFFNASPLKGLETPRNGSLLIDCDTNTESGRKMSFYTAEYQYKHIYKLPGIFEEVL